MHCWHVLAVRGLTLERYELDEWSCCYNMRSSERNSHIESAGGNDTGDDVLPSPCVLEPPLSILLPPFFYLDPIILVQDQHNMDTGLTHCFLHSLYALW
jgi:hypothetical protein